MLGRSAKFAAVKDRTEKASSRDAWGAGTEHPREEPEYQIGFTNADKWRYSRTNTNQSRIGTGTERKRVGRAAESSSYCSTTKRGGRGTEKHIPHDEEPGEKREEHCKEDRTRRLDIISAKRGTKQKSTQDELFFEGARQTFGHLSIERRRGKKAL